MFIMTYKKWRSVLRVLVLISILHIFYICNNNLLFYFYDKFFLCCHFVIVTLYIFIDVIFTNGKLRKVPLTAWILVNIAGMSLLIKYIIVNK